MLKARQVSSALTSVAEPLFELQFCYLERERASERARVSEREERGMDLSCWAVQRVKSRDRGQVSDTEKL